MKTPLFLPLSLMVLSHNWLCGETDDPTRQATRTVILDETGVRNLRIETEQAKGAAERERGGYFSQPLLA